MKKYVLIIIFSFIWLASCIVYLPTPQEQRPLPKEEPYYEEDYRAGSYEVGSSYFYDYLSTYGIWVYHSRYGYVWIPEVRMYNWRPYTYGQWVWTDYGWTWISSFEWGWAPFHYGRWGKDNELGWFWVPGSTWGPAWIVWRSSNLYIGWAPIPPDVHFIPGIGIHTLPYSLNVYYWIFIDGRYFLNSRIYRYIIPVERNRTIIYATSLKARIEVKNDRIINRALDESFVRSITKRRITKYSLQDKDKVGPNKVRVNRVEVFRPTIKTEETAKPKVVLNKEEAKTKISKKKIAIPAEEETPKARRALEEGHTHEARILKETQEKELRELTASFNRRKKAARNEAEKRKIEETYKNELTKFKERHAEEEAQLKQRHKKEKTAKKKIRKF
ncbi:MAG: cell envelope integrity protein TolA [Candidatus Aminicenantes bacterium]|nr:cell envelope integrity protein TolA [Candidatus Aminicenantes bacterium]